MTARPKLAALIAALLLSACGFSRESRPAEGDSAKAAATPAEESEPMTAEAADAGAADSGSMASAPASDMASGNQPPAGSASPQHLEPIDDREARIAAAMRRDFEKYDANKSGGLDSAEFARLEADVLQDSESAQGSTPSQTPENLPLRREVVTKVAAPESRRSRQPSAAADRQGEPTEEAERKQTPSRPQSRPRPEYARPME